MKIGFFDPYLDTLGGGEKYMLTAASFLSKKHSVSIFWNNPKILTEAEERFGLEVEKIKIVNNLFSSSHSLLERMLLTQDYDIIFYLSDGSIPLLGCKKLYVHFQFPVQWVKPLSLFSKFKTKCVTKFICNSEFTKSYIDNTFGVKSIVVYPPVAEFFANTIKKKNIILSVGRFQKNNDGEWVKKQDVLIDVFKKMVDKDMKGWELVLAGSFLQQDKKLLDELRDKIGKYPIRIIENISLGDLHTLYREAKIYWHATGYGEDLEKYPERTEHFGISTVEAMQQKAVPVVIDAGGQPEIVADGINGFLWKTEQELMEKTRLLISDNKLLEKLQEHAKETSQRFTIERFEEAVQNLL